jgi:phage tail P2-like protein
VADTALLPPNATALERAVAVACRPATELPVPLRALWSPDACPVQNLPWLAWSFGVETWSADWTEEQKRAAIRNALPIKHVRGTVGAVKRVLGALGFSARLQEWHKQLPSGAPYTYRLLLDPAARGWSQTDLLTVPDIVSRAGNLRSHLSEIRIESTAQSNVYQAGAGCTGIETTVEYSCLRYSDGTPALDLMMDAALHGDESTIAAISSLHELVNAWPTQIDD